MTSLQYKFAHAKASPWNLGGTTPKQLALKVWQAMNDDDVLGRAGQLAYFFFFAVFPLGIFLVAVLGVVVGPDSPMAQNVADYITRAMPGSAAGLVHQTLQTDLSTPS